MAIIYDLKKLENKELEKVSGGENIITPIDDDWGEELSRQDNQQPRAQ